MYGLVTGLDWPDYIPTRELVEYSDQIQDKPMLVAIAALVLLILFYGSHDDPYEQAPAVQWFVYLIVLGQFCLSVVWTATFYLIQAPIVVLKKKPKKAEIERKKEKPIDYSKLEVFELPLPPVPVPPSEKTLQEWKEEQMDYAKASSYYIIFTMISFVSLCGPPHMQFFMFFWVLDYFRLPYGATVMLAVNSAGPTLFKIGFGAMLLAIMWTSWSFWLFQEDAQAFSGQSATVYQAILWGIHNGMRGDLRNSWGPIPKGNKNFPLRVDDEMGLAFQWLLVLLYHLVWRFVFIGILTATIVGAFAKIRGDQNARINDAKERCLVCSLSRFTLEQEGGGFPHHTGNHHNPWSYLAFLASIKLGNEDDFTGIESYVQKKSRMMDCTFFPVQACTEIQSGERRATREEENRRAVNEKESDGANDLQKKIVKALDSITSATMDLSVDLPTEFNERLTRLEAAMGSVTELVEKFAAKS